MQKELKVRGGTILNKVAHHPLAATIGALLVAAPCAFLTASVEGAAAGFFMGIVGVAVGAPLGGIIADDAEEATAPA